VQGYLDPEHPLQRAIRADLGELLGGAPEVLATDGCSAPTFGASVAGLAHAFRFLAAPEEAPPRLSQGLARAAAAMRAHPELVHAPGKLDAVVMGRFDGVTAKRGAAGCYALAAPHPALGPIGVALKIEDGSDQARDVAVFEVLAALGLTPSAGPTLDPWRRPILRNCRGREVGRLEAEIRLSLL
jgi:L-asparaginase II